MFCVYLAKNEALIHQHATQRFSGHQSHGIGKVFDNYRQTAVKGWGSHGPVTI
jgi:hypothetical protein